MIATIIGYVVITVILINSVSNAFKNIYDNTIILKRFAWFPTKVETWRETTAVIWLQTYYVYKSNHKYHRSLHKSKFVDRLGMLSMEFR